MRVDALQYELPPELVAQHPATERESARLMILARGAPIEQRRVGDLASLLPPGALVVINDTRVIPARLIGRKHDTGGRVEVFLVQRVGDRALEISSGETRTVQIWRALGKSSKALKFGSDVDVLARGADSGPP